MIESLRRPPAEARPDRMPRLAEMTPADAVRFFEAWHETHGERRGVMGGLITGFGHDPEARIAGEVGGRSYSGRAVDLMMSSPPSYGTFARFYVLGSKIHTGSPSHGLVAQPYFNPFNHGLSPEQLAVQQPEVQEVVRLAEQIAFSLGPGSFNVPPLPQAATQG